MKIVSCEHFFKLNYYKMKLSLRLLLLLPFIFIMVGCPNDDIPETVEARPYADVYAEDIAEIEGFMDTHFMTVDGNYNVTYTKITGSTPGTPISSRPDLDFKTISKGGVDHKLYFIKLNEGVGSNPTVLDSVFSSYKGHKTDLSVFDSASSPIWFQLQQVIQGWQEIFPEFKTGNLATDPLTGVTTYSDFGAGVMFVPSGLGYYNQAVGSISSYSPLIFNFKLMKLKYRDHDGDKILSKDEYGGPTSGTALDTDGDGKPNYADFDDDNDGKLTKEEIRITTGVSSWYPFASIPTCGSGGNGKKKHLDPFCY
jgi:FKBP-type peptidyl-prolyl cis-trans isomerase FkpA